MLILYSITLFFSQSLYDLSALIGLHKENLFSTKDYLLLESEHHPSWIIRLIFRYLLRKMREGKSLSQLVKIIGLDLPPSTATISDLKNIFYALGTPHPESYPIDVIVRLIMLLIFHIGMLEMNDNSHLFVLYGLVFLLVIKEQWEWIFFKVRSAQLYCWQSEPLSQMSFNQHMPMPTFIKNKWEKKVWAQIYQMGQTLEHSSELFAVYWKSYYLRQAVMRRKALTVTLTLLTMMLFITLIIPLLSGFYQGSFLQ